MKEESKKSGGEAQLAGVVKCSGAKGLGLKFEAGVIKSGRLSLQTLCNNPACHAGTLIMNKRDIAETLRNEVGALDGLIRKLKARSDRLKQMVLELEEELAGPAARKEIKMLGPDSKFRKVIDRVFGETPKQPKR